MKGTTKTEKRGYRLLMWLLSFAMMVGLLPSTLSFAESYTTYALVATPQQGKSYVIITSNTPGSGGYTIDYEGEASTDGDGDFKEGKVYINAASGSITTPYINYNADKDSNTHHVMTIEGSGTSFKIKCSRKDDYLSVSGTSELERSSSGTTYTYTNNYLMVGSKYLYLNGKHYYLTSSQSSATKFYFYEKGSSGSSTTSYTYTVTYNANGGSGTVPSTQSATSTATSYTFEAAAGSSLSKSGATFAGWSESASATTATYVAGATISLTSSNNSKTLYAVWTSSSSEERTFRYTTKFEDGKNYIIIDSSRRALNGSGNSTSNSTTLTMASGSIGTTGSTIKTSNSNVIWNASAASGKYYLQNEGTSTYLGRSSSSIAMNELKTRTFSYSSNKLSNSGSSTYYLRNSSSKFSYSSSSSSAVTIYLYEEVVDEADTYTISAENMTYNWSTDTWTNYLSIYADDNTAVPLFSITKNGSQLPFGSGSDVWNFDDYTIVYTISSAATTYVQDDGGDGWLEAQKVPGTGQVKANLYSSSDLTSSLAECTFNVTITGLHTVNWYSYDSQSIAGPVYVTAGDTYDYPGSTPSPAPTSSDYSYTWIGWSTTANNTAASSATVSTTGSFTAPSSTSGGSTVNWYATYSRTSTASTYYATLTYDANGGSNPPSEETKSASSSAGSVEITFTVSDTAPSRDGYSFLGWATSPNATSAAYQAGDNFSITATSTNASSPSPDTLYAVWEETGTIVDPTPVSSGNMHLSKTLTKESDGTYTVQIKAYGTSYTETSSSTTATTMYAIQTGAAYTYSDLTDGNHYYNVDGTAYLLEGYAYSSARYYVIYKDSSGMTYYITNSGSTTSRSSGAYASSTSGNVLTTSYSSGNIYSTDEQTYGSGDTYTVVSNLTNLGYNTLIGGDYYYSSTGSAPYYQLKSYSVANGNSGKYKFYLYADNDSSSSSNYFKQNGSLTSLSDAYSIQGDKNQGNDASQITSTFFTSNNNKIYKKSTSSGGTATAVTLNVYSETTTTVAPELTAAVIRDTVNTSDFDISGATYKVETMAVDIDGQESGSTTTVTGATAVPSNGQIVTSTYNYKTNAASDSASGREVILTITGLTVASGRTGTLSSNSGNAGVYASASDSDPYISIGSPTVVIAQETGSFTIQIVKVEASDRSQSLSGDAVTYDLSENSTMNATALIDSGFLYGGMYGTFDGTLQDPVTFSNGETGLAFTPAAGATYYVKEVPTSYLTTKTLYRYSGVTLTDSYLITAVDSNTDYYQTGFVIDGTNTSVTDDTVYKCLVLANGPIAGSGNTGTQVSMYVSDLANDKAGIGDALTKVPVNAAGDTEDFTDSSNVTYKQAFSGTSGYLAFYPVAIQENKISAKAYWVTHDGVLVTGTNVRKVVNGRKSGEDEPVATSATTFGTGTYTDSLTLKSIFVGADDVDEEEPEETGVKLAGYTTSLNGKIEMNFYLELSDEVAADSGAEMQFTLPGSNHTDEVVKLSDARKQVRGDKTYYVFSAGVAAKDMTSDIKAQFVQSDGTKSEVWTYNIKAYCDYIRNHPESYDETSVALVENMLNYGGYAQTYFNYNTSKLANADLDLDLPTVELDDSYDTVIRGECNGLTYLGSSAMLTTTTGLRHYFELNDAEAYTFKANGKELEVQSDTNGSYVLIDNIKAKDLRKPITLTVTDSEGNEFSLSYSVYTNIKQVVGNEDFSEASQNLMKALYGYGEAAKAYFAAHA